MTDKLSQKHAIKGTRTFELVGDEINVHIHMPFLDKEYTVVLSSLEPEPVVSGNTLAFVSGVNREPLVELFIDRPDPASFRAFVELLAQRVREEDIGKAGVGAAARQVDVDQLQESIDMLTTYADGDDFTALLGALNELKASPTDPDRLEQVFSAFNALGPLQGAVLTYAPYVSRLLAGDIPDPGPPGEAG